MDLQNMIENNSVYYEEFNNDVLVKYNKPGFHIKYNVKFEEAELHRIVYNMKLEGVNIPKPYFYDKDKKILVMQSIPELCISDMYGDLMEFVPEDLINEIRNIISCLYYNNIEYPDITGYNFIYYKSKMWLLDFGHANYNLDNKSYDPYIKTFIENKTTIWNPNYY